MPPAVAYRLLLMVAVCLSHYTLVSIIEVALCRAQLVLGWVTVVPVQKPISLYNQTPLSTQPGHPIVGRHIEYQPKVGAALRLGSKGKYAS